MGHWGFPFPHPTPTQGPALTHASCGAMNQHRSPCQVPCWSMPPGWHRNWFRSQQRGMGCWDFPRSWTTLHLFAGTHTDPCLVILDLGMGQSRTVQIIPGAPCPFQDPHWLVLQVEARINVGPCLEVWGTWNSLAPSQRPTLTHASMWGTGQPRTQCRSARDSGWARGTHRSFSYAGNVLIF